MDATPYPLHQPRVPCVVLSSLCFPLSCTLPCHHTTRHSSSLASPMRPHLLSPFPSHSPLIPGTQGLALAGAGEWRRAAEVFERGAALFPSAVQLWLEGGRAFKELGAVHPALHALERAVALEESTVAYHRLASLHQLTGDHRAAMESAQRGLRGNPGDIELNHVVASALHALGHFPAALRQYDHVLTLSAGDTPGAFHVLQFMAFYQREIAAYTVRSLDAPFTAFRLDHDLDLNFREAWVKKLSPWTLFPAYQPIRLTLPILSAASQASLPSLSKQALVLIGEADRIGQRTQYHVDGFFPNHRQYRMAGLAMLDIMQRVASTWQAMASATSSQNSSASYDPSIVRWRQIAEPTDTVAWIDALKNEFEGAFGSITAMAVGPSRNLKYHPLAPRALALLRSCLLATRLAANAAGLPLPLPTSRLPEIERAESVGEVHAVVGENFFVTTECHSLAFPGKVLNGTQLTVVHSGAGFDFAIRTPVTPPRWKQFDAELTAAWRDLCAAVLDRAPETADATRYHQRIQENILRIGYYWYQLMPLTRGSAMVGLIALLGLSMAAGMLPTAPIPRAMQVDWEAILEPHFAAFNASVAPWLYAPATVLAAPSHLPLVAHVLPTTRHVIAALNHQG
ncbi:unnamed protein product [Closterium sp. Yama58-4]|nr:unnamed protein product [Closterium sp. Yama58-4]